ncbi:hypothetical protein JAB5_07100 [Janthinobacterium sp. HH103]|uniref:hypothetical protein n=1 Tax=unclassified Janthinobacterium TaxID=2610881 RepID=UPI000892B50B|nr:MULTISPECIES: hypothetical protein [unclassified Janthinobacterium]OEZ72603.1 hypothetical protein JAB2_02060 [Janthinobacterium sp. HH100]OEZ86897.1 hypothetical protein JAB5_07100 [Janthinobacterium sp. HH103]QOU74003.1 hypothetical protein JAB4_034620 [Janthinobacterium sp. HH102]
MTASIVVATFIATEGEYLEAVIEVGGQRLHVMDEFGGGQLAAGAQVQLELWPMASEIDDWDAIFRANPGREKRLVRLDGWRYLALGIVTQVDPVVCDCGLLQLENPFTTHDGRCVGAYVGVTLARLDACLA